MNNPEKYLERRLRRLQFLSEILASKGFSQMADEVRSLTTMTEVNAFYDSLRAWLF